MNSPTPSSDAGRVLGIDFGEVRVGLALSDETRTLASPLPTLRRRRGKRPPVSKLARIALDNDVAEIVLGLPLELSGDESDWTRAVREVGRKLGERLELPVHFVDERMTSVMAEQRVRSSGLGRTRREEKDRVDAGAAVLILQRWLDFIPPSDSPPAEDA